MLVHLTVLEIPLREKCKRRKEYLAVAKDTGEIEMTHR